jgi:transposase InsO family protein
VSEVKVAPDAAWLVFATLEWVDWFNNQRLLEPSGNIPPAEAEERYYAMLEQPAMAP